MADYWKSVQKEWCEYCRVFVYPNAISRKKHFEGPKHKENMDRKIREMYAEKEGKTLTAMPKPKNYQEPDSRQPKEETSNINTKQIPRHLVTKIAEKANITNEKYNKNEFKALQSIIQNNHAILEENDEKEIEGPLLPADIEKQKRIERKETWDKSKPPEEWGNSLIAPWSTIEEENQEDEKYQYEEDYEKNYNFEKLNNNKEENEEDYYEYGIEEEESESKKLSKLFKEQDEEFQNSSTKKPVKISLQSVCGLVEDQEDGDANPVILKKRKVSKNNIRKKD